MRSGSAVHVKGFGFALVSVTKRLMAACRSTTDQKTPRLRRRRLSLAKKPSTAFSHEALVGVRWKTNRGCRSSHARTFGCLWASCVVATGLNGLAIFWLIDRASPQFVALGDYMMPIGNIILAMAVLGEVLAPGQYLGTVVILVGMALSNGGRGRQPSAVPRPRSDGAARSAFRVTTLESTGRAAGLRLSPARGCAARGSSLIGESQMKHLLAAVALLAVLGTHPITLADDATDDATDDEPAAAVEDPFALPPELQGPFNVNALPDPNLTVEQVKAEAEAAVQQMLKELGPNPTPEQIADWMQRHRSRKN